MMSSSICPHFTQNAWKKDLCSNCFKSKDEHKQAAAAYAAGKSYAFSTSRRNNYTSTLPSSRLEIESKKTDLHDYPNKNKIPAKSIIKKKTLSKPSKGRAHKVSFPKNLSEVIGYGGEWSDNDDDSDDDDHDFMNLSNERDETAATSTDDEETLDLKRITRANTDFNMNNGNLLGDPQENIKKSFAALKLGAPQVDKEGKKQTLKINVVPFGATSAPMSSSSNDSSKSKITTMTTTTSKAASFESKTDTITKQESLMTTAKTTATAMKSQTTQQTANSTLTKKASTTTNSTTTVVKTVQATSFLSTAATIPQAKIEPMPSEGDGKSSPPIERAMEKSLLDEISETLELQQNESKKITAAEKEVNTNSNVENKIKFEITSLAETLENKTFLDLKKPIARNPPITKDHQKPKINVFHKYSDSESNCSDTDGVSAYYDVVETQVSYENLPDGKCAPKDTQTQNAQDQPDNNNTTVFTSSQYITDMLLSSKTRAASYNLHEGNFMTSKITSDGLIVTKCSSDDALDSTGSSFDGSSDEETSYNMTRSESDSGIGISIGNDYKSIIPSSIPEQERERQSVEKKLSASNNNSDYEDIQVAEQALSMQQKVETTAVRKTPENLRKPTFTLEKSRELHGEPDGSADPDGSLETKERSAMPTQLPALPKSPPPTKIIDPRPSFLHGLKQHPAMLLKKPDLPAKPIVSPVNNPMKTFTTKRQPTLVEQQVINQLQLVMSKSSENLTLDSSKDDAKLKKGRAPNPPPDHKTSAPPTPERDYNITDDFTQLTSKHEVLGRDAETAAATETDKSSENKTAEQMDANKIADNEANKSSSLPTETDKNNDQYSASTANVTKNVMQISSAASAATVSSSATSNFYARKTSATVDLATNNNTKNTPAPAVREKDKRERATINPKFRSLNTFVTHRNNAAKHLLFHTMTPEPKPRTNSLSMSEECLAPSADTTTTFVSASNIDLTKSLGDKKSPNIPSPTTAPKTKTKFSIKKFLRMGASSKTTESINKKEGGAFSEVCTGEESGVVGKPRLVIIHPIDINTTGVEVVKDITKTSDAVAAQTIAVITAKPPAPPLRATDGQRGYEMNKPARPPPPKSAELRRKQKIALSDNNGGSQTLSAALETASTGGSLKCKADNVYANLGEIRSSIAPRKPERTASMREREAQLELARKRHAGQHNENVDTVSICSSNGENVLADQEQQLLNNSNKNTVTTTTTTLSSQLPNSGRVATLSAVDGKPPTGSSRTSTFERKKNDTKIATKLEIFENLAASPTNGTAANGNSDSRQSSLKDSVRKINSTIDSYLKDKRDFDNMYEFVKTAVLPPPPPTRTVDLATVQRNAAARRAIVYSDTASVASYSRSEYGPVRNYGLNNSLANIPRVISASYCGSEVGEFDIYSPYSYYGSETGGDVATDINDSVWGIPSALKNRSKATNRLRMRKGRSVVHKNIEDNYTAVVVANHEALAQVLDQLQQTPIIPPALRPLANAINLRFEDFTILDGAQAFVVGKKAFHAALWTNGPVTLALSADSNQLAGVGGELSQLSGGVCDVLNPITEFCDLVPSYHLPLMPSTEVTLLQATISVLPRLQLDSLQSIGTILKGKSQVLDKSNFNFRGSIPNLAVLKDLGGASNGLRNVVSVQNLSTLNEGESMDKGPSSPDAEQPIQGMPAFDDIMTREVTFIMLQLVNGMKNLQVKAIEEMPLSLSNVVLSKDVENKDAQARLCVLQGNNNDEDEPMGTLCKCAHIALTEMLPPTKITPLLADILLQERSESLSKSKSVLEFVLWGPSDVVLSGSTKERELALQRWLDLERATVLHGLVRTRVELTVYDECHLMFLVRSNAKMMNDAAKIVFGYQQPVAEKE